MPGKLLWGGALQSPDFTESKERHVRTNLRRTKSQVIPVGKRSRDQEAQRRDDLQGRRKRRCQRLRTGPLPGHALLRAMEPSARGSRGSEEVHGRKQVPAEAKGVTTAPS